MDDDQILALYEQRSEQAISETVASYGSYCRTIVGRILEDPEDVEEVLSDTWLKAWQAIPPNKPRYLKLFLGKIARNQALSTYRAQTSQKQGGSMVQLALDELEECVPGPNEIDSNLNQEILKDGIEKFLRTESRQARMVFVRRYFYLEDTEQIARRYGIRESNVLMILSRTRKKLKQYLIQEGYDL